MELPKKDYKVKFDHSTDSIEITKRGGKSIRITNEFFDPRPYYEGEECEKCLLDYCPHDSYRCCIFGYKLKKFITSQKKLEQILSEVFEHL